MVGSSPSTSSLMSLQQSRILTPYYACKGTSTSSNCNFKLHFVSVNKKRKKKQESFFGSHGGAVAIARKNKNNVARIFPSEASFVKDFKENNKRRSVIVSPCNSLKASVEETEVNVSESSSEDLIRKELSSLDAYFDKLQGKDQVKKEVVKMNVTKSSLALNDASTETALRSELKSLEQYLDKLAQGSNSEQPSIDSQKPSTNSMQDLETVIKEMTPSMQISSFQEALGQDSELGPDDSVASESYVVYAIVAINVAVYLFGLASPVDTVGVGTSTLPVLYGAKVNALILGGEWWRLITPMFLHSGFLHVALSSWALLFFGPQVESVFGSLAFGMIYFLGGLCGNTFSYFFTPAATVGGTGPLFALFTAWVAYLWQNRKAIGEKSADDGIKATTFMSLLVFCLSLLLPTDEWIHVGALFPGLFFGAFSSPVLEVAVDSEVNKKKESKGGAYAIYDSPSMLSLTIVFIICTALCFVVLSLFDPVAELELLDTLPF